jgi:hypothetical protein
MSRSIKELFFISILTTAIFFTMLGYGWRMWHEKEWKKEHIVIKWPAGELYLPPSYSNTKSPNPLLKQKSPRG